MAQRRHGHSRQALDVHTSGNFTVAAAAKYLDAYPTDKRKSRTLIACAEPERVKADAAVPEDQVRREFAVLLTVQAMNYLHSGGHGVFLG